MITWSTECVSSGAPNSSSVSFALSGISPDGSPSWYRYHAYGATIFGFTPRAARITLTSAAFSSL